MFCTNCGSQNHLSGDCNKPRRDVPLLPPTPAPQPKQAAPNPAVAKPQPAAEVTGTIPHRLRGMPDVCARTLLPYFPNDKAANDYQSANCPETGGNPVPCAACGGVHLQPKAEKDIENQTGWRKPTKPFLREATRRDIDDRIGRQCVAEKQNLNETPAKPERTVKLPRSKPKQEEPSLL